MKTFKISILFVLFLFCELFFAQNCPDGRVWSKEKQTCVIEGMEDFNASKACEEGYSWNKTESKCKAIEGYVKNTNMNIPLVVESSTSSKINEEEENKPNLISKIFSKKDQSNEEKEDVKSEIKEKSDNKILGIFSKKDKTKEEEDELETSNKEENSNKILGIFSKKEKEVVEKAEPQKVNSINLPITHVKEQIEEAPKKIVKEVVEKKVESKEPKIEKVAEVKIEKVNEIITDKPKDYTVARVSKRGNLSEEEIKALNDNNKGIQCPEGFTWKESASICLTTEIYLEELNYETEMQNPNNAQCEEGFKWSDNIQQCIRARKPAANKYQDKDVKCPKNYKWQSATSNCKSLEDFLIK